MNFGFKHMSNRVELGLKVGLSFIGYNFMFSTLV